MNLNKIRIEIIGIILLICWLVAIYSVLHHHHQYLIAIGISLLILVHFERAWNGYSFNKLNSKVFIHAIAILIPVSLLWILYSEAIEVWWTNDDPQILYLTIKNGIWPHFYDSTIWRMLSAANLTPWVNLSIGIDWHIFGLNPKGFYWHHLISFSIIIVIAYWVLKSFFSPFITSVILSIFIASVSSGVVAQLLMTRHYLEGFGLSLLAFGFYLKALRDEKIIWAIVGSCFYLFATTAKEIYVPIVVILPFLPINTLKQRWKMTSPFVLVAGLYVVWRIYMLTIEFTFSGYGDEVVKPHWADTFNILGNVIELMGWNTLWQQAILVLFLFVYLFILYKQILTSRGIFPLLWIIVVIIPIIPVVNILDPRFLFLPYFMLCISFGYVLQFLIKQHFFYPIVVFLSLSILLVSLKTVETSFLWKDRDHLQRYAVEGNFIMKSSNSEASLLDSVSPYFTAFYWLRENILKLPPGPKMCDDICICKYINYYKYNYKSKSIVPLQVSQPLKCNMTKPLFINITYFNEIVEWQFGPYQSGQYFVLLQSYKPIAFNTKGKMKAKLKDSLKLHIKYVSPEGFTTYSPMLNFDPNDIDINGIAKLKWQRSAELEK